MGSPLGAANDNLFRRVPQVKKFWETLLQSFQRRTCSVDHDHYHVISTFQ